MSVCVCVFVCLGDCSPSLSLGELGKKIWENVSKEAWQQWIKHQTMLINENRLNLMDPKARKYLSEQMDRHFFGTGADAASGFVPPAQ